MARPPLPLGTWGTITTQKIRDGSYRALTRFRDTDGPTRRVTATGPSKAAAERALRDVLATRTAPAGELVTGGTRLIDLASLWITGLEAEGRIEQTTINEYRRVLDNLVLPSVGGLKLREATTGRLDRPAPAEVASSEREPPTQGQGRPRGHARHRGPTRCDPDQPSPRDQPGPRAEAGNQGPASRGPSRDPRRRTPMGQCRSAGPEAHGRHGRHHRSESRRWLPDREILALRWSDLELDGELPTLTVSGTIKTETGKGTYRKPTPKSDTSRRTVVLPQFVAELLRLRREFATLNEQTPSSLPATAPATRSSTSSGGGGRSARTLATSG